MDLQIWLAYVATAIVFSLAPGAGIVNSISNGISYGTRRSLAAIAGLQLGLAIQIAIVGAGLGTLLAGSALAFNLIKWFGAAYLIYLGIQKWRDASALAVDDSKQLVSRRTLFSQALTVSLTNPKSVIFLVALFPQFLDLSQPQLPQLIQLGFTTVLIDALVMLGCVGLAAQLGKKIRSTQMMSKLNKVFGGLFIGCGMLLAGSKM